PIGKPAGLRPAGAEASCASEEPALLSLPAASAPPTDAGGADYSGSGSSTVSGYARAPWRRPLRKIDFRSSGSSPPSEPREAVYRGVGNGGTIRGRPGR